MTADYTFLRRQVLNLIIKKQEYTYNFHLLLFILKNKTEFFSVNVNSMEKILQQLLLIAAFIIL